MSSRWQHDLVLDAFAKLPSPIGDLVEAFPGRAGAAGNPKWLQPVVHSVLVDPIVAGHPQPFTSR